MTRVRARRVALSLALVASALASPAAARPRVGALDEGARVPGRIEGPLPLAPRAALVALREEHAATQIVVEAHEPLARVAIDLSPLVGPGGAELELRAFVQHFVEVRARTRNDRIADSLAFTAAARPEGVLGLVPDALVPASSAPPWVGPLDAVPAGERRAFFVETFVPRGAPAGRYAGRAVVRAAGAEIGAVDVHLDVRAATLPYAAVGVSAFYERATLERRFADPDRVERQIWTELHAHHVDAVHTIVAPGDVARVTGALSGRWFTAAEGYAGPGEGRAPQLLFFGAYGVLGEPSPERADLVDALDAAAGAAGAVADRFVYAIDETCDSPRGPMWRALLAKRHRGVGVAHTCHLDPGSQGVDLAMIPAQAYDPRTAERATRGGQRVFAYNGQLPFAGPLMLDAPAPALTLTGWIAATYGVERWFFWETIFWNDGNRGGRGPRDPFADPETFHNADGDVALLDGLLFYPGRPHAPGALDLGVDGVVPSLRLRRLRRGLEDAGLLALAAASEPDAAARIARAVVPAALSDVGPDDRTALALDPAALAAARAALRDLARPSPPGAPPPERHLAELAARARALPARRPPTLARRAAFLVGLPLGVFALALALVRATRR